MSVPPSLEQMLGRAAVGETFSLREVGVALGISPERVRQIEAGALLKLKKIIVEFP
jgi:DNA-directed RNA polymerase sigma subunit (sigma70/sigma32)